MRRLGFVAGLILVLSLAATSPVQAQGERPVVKAYLFHSRTCPACHQVRTQVLPQLYQRFGQQLQIKAIDIYEDETNYRWLLACEKEYGVSEDEAAIPALFIGDKYLIGVPAIESQLPSLIEDHLNGGGVNYPDVPRPGEPLKSTVRFIFFFSPTCPYCQDVEENVFPRIRAKYGDLVQWDAYDVSQEANLRALLMLGQAAGLPEDALGSVPLVFVGDEFSAYTLLLGGQVQQYLESAIDWFVAIGGAGLPEWTGELFEVAATPSPQSTSATADVPTPIGTSTASETPSPEGPTIHVAYFAEVGCSECDRVSTALAQLQKRFPNLVIRKFDILDDAKVNLCLSEKLGVPENQRHDAPAIFVGSDYLIDRDVQYERLIQVVSQYTETGAQPTWEECRESEVELPPLPPWWLVVSSGLLDGINPCAFATMIFFVSYLSLIERKGRDIVLVGISFTLAVFLSYLGFGMVLRELLAGLIDLVGQTLRTVLNVLIAIACLVLAAFSFDDFRKARRGRVKDMALRLPDRLRKWVNATIRQSMKAQTFVVASFVAGVVVSFIELTCTGQVYVPIILRLSNPGQRMPALLALIVYCLAFVVPLIVVFVVSYMGTSSRQLGVLLQRHTASVKLATAVLFLCIGLWLLYDMLRTWGVISPLMT